MINSIHLRTVNTVFDLLVLTEMKTNPKGCILLSFMIRGRSVVMFSEYRSMV